jgi:hypothetical protein
MVEAKCGAPGKKMSDKSRLRVERATVRLIDLQPQDRPR